MPKPTSNLIFCVHAHQPVGNFGHVFEEAYKKCYEPFFKVLQRHERFSIACHFSGSLLDWLMEHESDFIQRLKKMGERGQIEFVGGAYYEPIYGIISRKDLTGQILMMRDRMEQLFWQTPRGAWLTERVWDPHLVHPLKKAGVEYTILDDTHFENAGVALPATGYYRASHRWETLDLFASQKKLRYLIPFHSPEEALDHVHSLSQDGQAVVFADDCEKFGFWPGTHDWVYDCHWLDNFLTLVEEDPFIRTQTFEQFRRSRKSRARVKIPHASYSEMMEWSGGNFRNFFDKYPESDYMRERMRSVSTKLQLSEDRRRRTEDRRQRKENGKRISPSSVFRPLSSVISPPSSEHESARLALYRAQCNCSYWHGVFGGLYLHHLRSSVYENLIRAEGFLEPSPALLLERFETGERWVLRQKNIVSYFNARYGGALEELDFLPRPANLVCTLQRRPEPYHSIVHQNGNPSANGAAMSVHEMLGSKEKDLAGALRYDPFRRLCFLDHFFEREITRAEFHESRYEDKGDFAAAPVAARRADGGVFFERRGQLKLEGKRRALGLKKLVFAKGDSTLRVTYRFHNPGNAPLCFVFAPEFNFSIGDSEALEGIDVSQAEHHLFRDSWRGIRIFLDSDSAGRLLATPVETVSGSEGGLEKTCQQLAVLFQKRFAIGPGESVTFALGLDVKEDLP